MIRLRFDLGSTSKTLNFFLLRFNERFESKNLILEKAMNIPNGNWKGRVIPTQKN